MIILFYSPVQYMIYTCNYNHKKTKACILKIYLLIRIVYGRDHAPPFSHAELKKTHIKYTWTCSKAKFSTIYLVWTILWRLKISGNDTEFRNKTEIIGKVAHNYTKIGSVFYKSKMHLTSAKCSINSVLSIFIINCKWTRK